MTAMRRRAFLMHACGAAAALVWPSTGVVAKPARPRASDLRVLGRTGLQCSYLGIGTGIRGGGPGITELTLKRTGEEIVALLQHAYERGIRYFDLADRYGSHHHMRLALHRGIPREKVLILSKLWSRDPAAARQDLERLREELGADVIDVVLLHCLREGEENWPETLRPLMDILVEAKARGRIRAHGVSCHYLPALERAAEEPWCDIVLVRVNPFGVNMDGPVDRVTSLIHRMHAAGTGVLGMKLLGEGKPDIVARMDESLAFAADVCALDAITIGFMSPQELDEVAARIDALAAV